MHKPLKILIVFLLACLLLQGCTRLIPENNTPKSPNIYASFYPLWALTSLVTAGTNANVHCLVQPQDNCLRNYALSDRDIYLLAYGADIVVAGGRGLESFESQLYALGDTGPVVITAFNDLVLYNEDDIVVLSDEDSHFDGANPHLYMSVSGAMQAIKVIAENLAMLDSANAAVYAENLASTNAKLEDLLFKMTAATQAYAGQPVILFNEALIYLAQDLSLNVSGWCRRESGANLSETELEDWLQTSSAESAQVILIEKQAPSALISALKAEGYAVAQIDIFAGSRADMGADHYFATQLANAQAIADAFAASENNQTGGN